MTGTEILAYVCSAVGGAGGVKLIDALLRWKSAKRIDQRTVAQTKKAEAQAEAILAEARAQAGKLEAETFAIQCRNCRVTAVWEIEQLSQRVERLQAHADTQETEIQQMRAENQQMRAENQQMRAENQQLRGENQELRQRVDQLSLQLQETLSLLRDRSADVGSTPAGGLDSRTILPSKR